MLLIGSNFPITLPYNKKGGLNGGSSLLYEMQKES